MDNMKKHQRQYRRRRSQMRVPEHGAGLATNRPLRRDRNGHEQRHADQGDDDLGLLDAGPEEAQLVEQARVEHAVNGDGRDEQPAGDEVQGQELAARSLGQDVVQWVGRLANGK